jgi:hypothetical protein
MLTERDLFERFMSSQLAGVPLERDWNKPDEYHDPTAQVAWRAFQFRSLWGTQVNATC